MSPCHKNVSTFEERDILNGINFPQSYTTLLCTSSRNPLRPLMREKQERFHGGRIIGHMTHTIARKQ